MGVISAAMTASSRCGERIALLPHVHPMSIHTLGLFYSKGGNSNLHCKHTRTEKGKSAPYKSQTFPRGKKHKLQTVLHFIQHGTD